jgi:hypothetical protein
MRHKQSFQVVDEHGVSQTLHLYVDILDAGTRGDADAEMEGLKRIRTEDGLTVNRLEKGKYQVAVTGQMLTSDDPTAP